MPKKRRPKLPSGTYSETSETSDATTSSTISVSQTTPARLLESLKAFKRKVEIVQKELAKQSENNQVPGESDRLRRWLRRMGDYLRGLCSGFRARLLAPMASLPEMKQKTAPLSSALLRQGSAKTAKTEFPVAVDLHRVYHSLNCSILLVPELLLVTHLFSSNRIFCNSLSELLSASEKELWQQYDGPLTERNLHQHLSKMLSAVKLVLSCCKIAEDWLCQHQDEIDNKIPAVSHEIARLQRLVDCQKLLKAKLETFNEEAASLDMELSEALGNLEPLSELQDILDFTTNQALCVSDSAVHVGRRIKAIENEILATQFKLTEKAHSSQRHKRNGLLPPIHRTKSPPRADSPWPLPPHEVNGAEPKQNGAPENNNSELDPLTLSQICHREISVAQRRLKCIDYIREVAMEDVEEMCMTMPFIVRQTDYVQSLVDKYENLIEEKRQSNVHLEETLAFINQETECATYLCGQVNLEGFTADLAMAASISMSHNFTETTNNDENKKISERTDSTGGKPPTVVYIKRRNQSQLSQPSSENNR